MSAPARDLWPTVMMQAVRDATARTDLPNKAEVEARMEARAWFDEAGEDFAEVCELAGLDPVAVSEAWKSGEIKRIAETIGGRMRNENI